MDREWELEALCRSREPEIWFSQKSLSRAKNVCLEAILARESQTADTLRSGNIAGLTGAQRAKVAVECSTGGQAQAEGSQLRASARAVRNALRVPAAPAAEGAGRPGLPLGEQPGCDAVPGHGFLAGPCRPPSTGGLADKAQSPPGHRPTPPRRHTRGQPPDARSDQGAHEEGRPGEGHVRPEERQGEIPDLPHSASGTPGPRRRRSSTRTASTPTGSAAGWTKASTAPATGPAGAQPGQQPVGGSAFDRAAPAPPPAPQHARKDRPSDRRRSRPDRRVRRRGLPRP